MILFTPATTHCFPHLNPQDYHLRIVNLRGRKRGWMAQVFYGSGGVGEGAQGAAAEREGPLAVDRCMSCDLDCPLVLGVLGHVPEVLGVPRPGPSAGGAAPAPDATIPPDAPGDAAGVAPEEAGTAGGGKEEPSAVSTAAAAAAQGSSEAGAPAAAAPGDGGGGSEGSAGGGAPGGGGEADDVLRGTTARHSLVLDAPHARCWLDAKARPLLVVTPRRHVERLSSLGPEEAAGLVAAAAEGLRRLGQPPVFNAIVNHGNNRNHAHLHIKVWTICGMRGTACGRSVHWCCSCVSSEMLQMASRPGSVHAI